MTSEQFKSQKLEEVYIVDIREPAELAFKETPTGAQNIPLQSFAEMISNGEFPKDRLIVTVCASGARSQYLHSLLINQGYKADYLEGGLSTL